jgi:uncharacterized protein
LAAQSILTFLENFPRYTPSFYRSSSGAEIDLVLEKGSERIVVEIKSSAAPKVTQGFFEALRVVEPAKLFVIAPVGESFPLKDGVWVYNLADFLSLEL